MKTSAQQTLNHPANLVIEKITKVGNGDDQCEDFPFLLFALRDNNNREFTLDTKTLLECLWLSEHEANIPPLPNKWWQMVWNHIPFEFHTLYPNHRKENK